MIYNWLLIYLKIPKVIIIFNLGKLTKSKLRCLLFSFAMYKSSPSDINLHINEYCENSKKDEFTYDDLCKLVQLKYTHSKERDIDDTWSLLTSKHNNCSKNEMFRALKECNIDTNENEIEEMMQFLTNTKNDFFTKDEFKLYMS